MPIKCIYKYMCNGCVKDNVNKFGTYGPICIIP